jgi:hypothetical protein
LAKISRVALVISLSVNIFLLASIAMYGTWLVSYNLDEIWRGITAFTAWIVTFGIGAIVFWKIVERVSAE